MKKRQQNKTHYDKSAKNLPALQQGDIVRHQKDMTKSVESKDQPVILASIKLYQKVLVIV